MSTSDHELIRNAIAFCSIAYYTKDWEGLKAHLTEDCVFHYSEPLGIAKGSDECAEQIQKAIKHLETQHSLTTQVIELTSDKTAAATTYVRAIHFLEDKYFFAEGRYVDKLMMVNSKGTKEWKLAERKAITMGTPRGDWSLLG